MILIDYSQIAISNIAVQLAMSKDKNVLSSNMVRHMILNSIRGFVHRFKNDYPDKEIHIVTKLVKHNNNKRYLKWKKKL